MRRAIGEVATAYGIYLAPHNVAAGGQSCPLRFRCVGCDHFRTDVSYLPTWSDTSMTCSAAENG